MLQKSLKLTALPTKGGNHIQHFTYRSRMPKGASVYVCLSLRVGKVILGYPLFLNGTPLPFIGQVPSQMAACASRLDLLASHHVTRSRAEFLITNTRNCHFRVSF